MQNHVKRRFNNTNVNVMAAIAIGAMLVFSVAGTKAFADNIQDDIEVTPAERTITQGESTTVKYWIDANSAGGGSFTGCDAADGSSAQITLNAPSGVTVSPATLTFSQCGNEDTNTKSATYSSNTPGDYPITVSTQDTHGNYNENPAKFTLHVTATPPPPSDTTAPELILPGNIVKEATGPIEVTFEASATDDVDGSVNVTCDPASGSTFPLGETTVNCKATDAAGNEATGSFTVTVQDKTPPTLTLPSAPPAIEATSPQGAEVTYGAATATDLVDGSVTVTCTPASGSTFPIATTPVNSKATDAAGNEATGSFDVKVQDTIKPEIHVTSTISNGQQIYFGDVPSTPTCTATDSGSGVTSAGCTVSGYSQAVGPHTLIFTATDEAGNKAEQTISYTVLAWTINGFYQPVDMNN